MNRWFAPTGTPVRPLRPDPSAQTAHHRPPPTDEREDIESWLATKDTSPMTNKKLDHKHLMPNINLRQTINDWKEKHPGWEDL